MKNAWLSILTICLCSYSGKTQLVLDKAGHEPKIGDINKQIVCDSASSIPKVTGAGMLWNFTQLVKSSTVQTMSYLALSTSTSSVYFPTADFYGDNNGEVLEYYKSAATPTTQFEFVGAIDLNDFRLLFSSPVIKARWPIIFGSVFTSSFTGSIFGSETGTIFGNEILKGTGTGTLIMPGGVIFNNVMQVVTSLTIVINETLPSPFTTTNTNIEYCYFDIGQKFPLVTVSYETFSGPGSTYSVVNIKSTANAPNLTGFQEQEKSEMCLYPNPAKEILHFESKCAQMTGNIAIFDVLGRCVLAKGLDFEEINIQNLLPGIYTVIYSAEGIKEQGRFVKE